MAERVHTYTNVVLDGRGVEYRVHADGAPDDLGAWHGWLVFEPQSGGGPVLRTGRETTQPNREDLEYWASGLEPIYLDGAIERATPA